MDKPAMSDQQQREFFGAGMLLLSEEMLTFARTSAEMNRFCTRYRPEYVKAFEQIAQLTAYVAATALEVNTAEEFLNTILGVGESA